MQQEWQKNHRPKIIGALLIGSFTEETQFSLESFESSGAVREDGGMFIREEN